MTPRREILTAKLGKDLWSFGYVWGEATRPDTLRADADREAALPGTMADAIALRTDRSHPQYGLGYLEPHDRTRGMVAAVALTIELAKQTVVNAIGLFEVPGGYWLSILESDLIPIDGDQIYADLHDALAVFEGRLRRQTWNKIYLPAVLLEESRQRYEAAQRDGSSMAAFDAFLADRQAEQTKTVVTTPLIDVLRASKGPHHRQRTVRRTDMRAVTTSRPAVASYALVGTVAAVFLIILPTYRWLTAPPPVKEVVAAPVLPAPPPPPPPEINTPAPSTTAPRVGTWLRACYDMLAMLDDAEPAGWTIDHMSCQGQGANAHVARAGGKIEDLEAAYKSASSLVFDQTYDTATIALVRISPPAPRSEQLGLSEPLRRRLVELGWSTKEIVTVESFVPPGGRNPADKATWKQAEFKITTSTDIGTWAPVLDQIPGLVATDVSIDAHLLKTDPEKFSWEIKGYLNAL